MQKQHANKIAAFMPQPKKYRGSFRYKLQVLKEDVAVPLACTTKYTQHHILQTDSIYTLYSAAFNNTR